ncbi:hypothetical protein Z043_113416 [Scleropages formosus]|uniref:NAD(P)-binding domain-containing protein n=1 Tax=Scleropages formosus TaxID=113540 RepID=A0A0P7UDL7_SCLFO|nr:hypothetical protein Z043_113416 [Scleropages formosus]
MLSEKKRLNTDVWQQVAQQLELWTWSGGGGAEGRSLSQSAQRDFRQISRRFHSQLCERVTAASNMRIAVLGATGQTGQYLVNQALQQGHVVTAVVRNPGKLTTAHDNLKVNGSCLHVAQQRSC